MKRKYKFTKFGESPILLIQIETRHISLLILTGPLEPRASHTRVIQRTYVYIRGRSYALLSIFGCNESADNKGIRRVHSRDRIPPLPLSIANSHGREISHYRYTLHYRAPFLFPNSIEIHGDRVAGPNNTRRLNRVTDGYKSSDFDIVAHPKATKFSALYIKNTMQRLPVSDTNVKLKLCLGQAGEMFYSFFRVSSAASM